MSDHTFGIRFRLVGLDRRTVMVRSTPSTPRPANELNEQR
jgi:hypothetical protein